MLNIECACGCGERITSIDDHGEPRKYIRGHNSRKYPKGYCRKKAWYKKHPKRAKETEERRKEKRRKKGKQLKVELVNLKGGKCVQCNTAYNGRNAAGFDFHHRDPKQKSFGITFGIRNKTKKEILEEIKKCDLMCKICHNMLHFGEY